MKSLLKKSLLFFLLLLGVWACSSTNYIPYEGGGRQKGKGASVQQINGIDVWYDGLPPRPYKIIGIIHDRRSGLRKSSLLKDITKKAKKMGADGLLEYQAYGVLPGGATAALGSAAGQAIWVAGAYGASAATGPGLFIAAPVLVGLSSATGGQSRWWVIKYLAN
ncbi:hypothetical protein A946_07875 [Methylacidiphilum kamchatkense Kam1]|uniref:Uncharacterized protein n=1 Tax=Methylacidiphilum kamchatkense Kam1 TaxID=1202785 RepID=A0A0C1URB0_9BACT|nr:hypothetical protein [Methylacidiphilum kamchatkense]KIE58393.1 hypothetical protein A946_07875 [Methylacidiphilum kamchatkense Kam1]QDQ42200.1 hypothetical protein kam1_967 [Methylacidiphilum kamchatkense Kam1]